MTTPATPQTVEELREAQRREYGQFVAAVSIDIDGAHAFNVGDAVPASHVESGLVSRDHVVGTKTKTAAALTTEKG